MKSGGICAFCGRVFGDTSKLVVHHKDELVEGDELNLAKSLGDDNLVVVCRFCHDEHHDRFKRNKRVMIVYGAPFSGKTTFVKENKDKDDLVIDLDRILSAISLNEPYALGSESVRQNAFAIRSLLLDHVRTRYGYWRTAWIIGGFPSLYERDRLAREYNADVVFIEATKKECLQRLAECHDNRASRKDEWVGFINEWFERYTPPSQTDRGL